MAGGMRVATLMPVRKMNRAIKFYTKTLGGKLNARGQGEMKDFWASVNLSGSELWLVAPSEREKRKLAYTTLIVKDIKRTVSGLTKKGVKFDRAERMGKETRVEGPIAFESFGASAFFKDPEGNLLMVWQDFMM
ncbi:MAG TPA: VOC family protein [Thermoplasmata archaeon]|nr:VOC family protein [Thermoplasmata archaeon]